EAVAPTRARCDISPGLAVVAQHFTQHGDVYGQVVLFNYRIRPQVLHQIGFVEVLAALLHEQLQSTHEAPRQFDRLAVFVELLIGNVKTVGAEIVTTISKAGPVHNRVTSPKTREANNTAWRPRRGSSAAVTAGA